MGGNSSHFFYLMHNNVVNKYSNHIAIIGAGISGLALGCMLKKTNNPVVIFEKSKDKRLWCWNINLSKWNQNLKKS